MVVDDIQRSRVFKVIVEFGVVRAPIVEVALGEKLHLLVGREVQLAAVDILIALVERGRNELRCRVVDPTFRVLRRGGQTQRIGEVHRVFGTHGADVEAAIMLGPTGLKVLVTKGAETM